MPRVEDLGINTNSSAAFTEITGSSAAGSTGSTATFLPHQGGMLQKEDCVPYYKMDAKPRGQYFAHVSLIIL